MNFPYLLYKSHEPALIKAFDASNLYPEVDSITHSDMIATGGTIHSSRVKISFTAKKGLFIRYYMYIPGSDVSKQNYLSKDEKAVVQAWLDTIHNSETSVKKAADNKV
jgi:hypothetical protein